MVLEQASVGRCRRVVEWVARLRIKPPLTEDLVEMRADRRAVLEAAGLADEGSAGLENALDALEDAGWVALAPVEDGACARARRGGVSDSDGSRKRARLAAGRTGEDLVERVLEPGPFRERERLGVGLERLVGELRVERLSFA